MNRKSKRWLTRKYIGKGEEQRLGQMGKITVNVIIERHVREHRK